MTEKIVQTAGRNQLGEFSPMFAHLNDDVLFGEVWNEEAIDVKTKCIITVVSLMASGIQSISQHYDDSEYSASCEFRADCLLWHGHEQLCRAVPLWNGSHFICPQDASFHVPLGFRADGAAPGNAYTGDNSCFEPEG